MKIRRSFTLLVAMLRADPRLALPMAKVGVLQIALSLCAIAIAIGLVLSVHETVSQLVGLLPRR
jgi:hypothetical protein